MRAERPEPGKGGKWGQGAVPTKHYSIVWGLVGDVGVVGELNSLKGRGRIRWLKQGAGAAALV